MAATERETYVITNGDLTAQLVRHSGAERVRVQSGEFEMIIDTVERATDGITIRCHTCDAIESEVKEESDRADRAETENDKLSGEIARLERTVTDLKTQLDAVRKSNSELQRQLVNSPKEVA